MGIIRDHLNVDLQVSLYDYVLSTAQAVTVIGISATGDITPKFYQYDANSSATDDGENVIKPTSVVGNGRFLKLPDIIPSGVITPYAGSSAPIGYLMADGADVSRTTYANLFTVIGTTYGSGDGSTTFNLPDLRQKFPLGKAASGTGNTLGATGGSIDHVHTVDPPNTTTSAPSASIAATNLLNTAASPDHTHDVDIAQFNSGTANPPFIALNYIIKF